MKKIALLLLIIPSLWATELAKVGLIYEIKGTDDYATSSRFRGLYQFETDYDNLFLRHDVDFNYYANGDLKLTLKQAYLGANFMDDQVSLMLGKGYEITPYFIYYRQNYYNSFSFYNYLENFFGLRAIYSDDESYKLEAGTTLKFGVDDKNAGDVTDVYFKAEKLAEKGAEQSLSGEAYFSVNELEEDASSLSANFTGKMVFAKHFAALAQLSLNDFGLDGYDIEDAGTGSLGFQVNKITPWWSTFAVEYFSPFASEQAASLEEDGIYAQLKMTYKKLVFYPAVRYVIPSETLDWGFRTYMILPLHSEK